MIAFPAGVTVWIAGGVTDMRRGMGTLALQVQEGLGRDPRMRARSSASVGAVALLGALDEIVRIPPARTAATPP